MIRRVRRLSIALPRGLTAHALLLAPLMVRGRALGAMTLGLESLARRFDVDMLATVAELADPGSPRRGLLQILLALALWPVHRYLPESRALALLYAELARSAASGGSATEAPAATEATLAARAALAGLESARSVEAELTSRSSARRSALAWPCSR